MASDTVRALCCQCGNPTNSQQKAHPSTTVTVVVTMTATPRMAHDRHPEVLGVQGDYDFTHC
jgi:uncharacterized OB-fold protein